MFIHPPCERQNCSIFKAVFPLVQASKLRSFLYWRWFLIDTMISMGGYDIRKLLFLQSLCRSGFVYLPSSQKAFVAPLLSFTLRQEPVLDWMNEWSGAWIVFVFSLIKLWSDYPMILSSAKDYYLFRLNNECFFMTDFEYLYVNVLLFSGM